MRIRAFLLNRTVFQISFVSSPPMVTDKWICGCHCKSRPNECIARKIPTVIFLLFASSKTASMVDFTSWLNNSLCWRKNPHNCFGIVKVMCWYSVMGNTAFCFSTHWSVARLPQVGQNRLLHAWVMCLIWPHSGFEQQSVRYPLIKLPHDRILTMFSVTSSLM